MSCRRNSPGRPCCNTCDPSCVGVLANTFSVDIAFDGTHSIIMTNIATSPACPSWSGSVCWSAASTLCCSCSVDTTLTPTCTPAACSTCGETVSSEDPVTWPGQPAYTTVGFGSRHKFSVNRWDKTKYYAYLSVVPQGGTLYKVYLQIQYTHSIRFTLSSCVEYCYAIITQGACPDDTAPNDGIPYSGTRTCSVGSLVGCGTSPTLPAHIDPFENSEAIVCPAVSFPFPFSSGVNHACTAISYTVVNVAITSTTCVCCDPGTGAGYWTTPALTQAVNTGAVCNSDLLAVYCADTGGAGGFPSICDEGLLVTMTIDYESASIECTTLCSAAIRLERIPVSGEANPPVDIAASTLSRTACNVTGVGLNGLGSCVINQDRPLIAKPAEIYVSLCAPTLITPTTAALVLRTFAPAANLPGVYSPSDAALVLTTFSPTIRVPQNVVPTTAALVLTTFVPTIIPTPTIITPPKATLLLTQFAPTVT